MGAKQGDKTGVDAIRNIQLKVPADLYRRFKLVCAANDTNMRAMLLRIMEVFTEHEEGGTKMEGNDRPDIMDWIEDRKLQEKIFGEATKEAIASAHAAGLYTTHGDDKGVFRLYPDGHREYITEEEREEILKGIELGR